MHSSYFMVIPLLATVDSAVATQGQSLASSVWLCIGVVVGMAIGVVGYRLLRLPSRTPQFPPAQPNSEPNDDGMTKQSVLSLNPYGVADLEKWLISHVLLECFHNQDERMNSFLEGVIACSNGEYCAAVKVGDDFDRKKMRASEMLLAGAKVREVKYCGLMDAKSGNVLMKAYVN